MEYTLPKIEHLSRKLLISSVGEFQRAIEGITRKVGVKVFIDDIIVSGSAIAKQKGRVIKLRLHKGLNFTQLPYFYQNILGSF